MNWRLSREKKANFTFILALALLLLGGLVGAITIQRYFDSARRVTHSYRVKIALGDIDSTVFILSRSRLGYISSAENSFLQEFEATRDKLPVAFQQLDELTRDNPTMRQLSAELQDLENQRLGILTASVQMQQRGNSDANQQREYSRSFAIVGSSSTKVVQQMQQVEQNLLRQRIQISDRLLSVAITALSFIFLLAISLLTLHYRFLRIEARERQRAEAEARQSADASRRLSARLLTLQDEERRKFSRELHDSLGQSLTAAKMICDTAAQKNPSDTQMAQIGQILDGALTETRTISHLLHPPLLDEIGLASAARWYVEGFAQRSGVPVEIEVPDNFPRLPSPTEIALFRVLQESLTNIHRHAKCTKAMVTFFKSDSRIGLQVEDNGQGLPAPKKGPRNPQGFKEGVGLAGMRERIREQGGTIQIASRAQGTLVSVDLPVPSAK